MCACIDKAQCSKSVTHFRPVGRIPLHRSVVLPMQTLCKLAHSNTIDPFADPRVLWQRWYIHCQFLPVPWNTGTRHRFHSPFVDGWTKGAPAWDWHIQFRRISQWIEADISNEIFRLRASVPSKTSTCAPKCQRLCTKIAPAMETKSWLSRPSHFLRLLLPYLLAASVIATVLWRFIDCSVSFVLVVHLIQHVISISVNGSLFPILAALMCAGTKWWFADVLICMHAYNNIGISWQSSYCWHFYGVPEWSGIGVLLMLHDCSEGQRQSQTSTYGARAYTRGKLFGELWARKVQLR